MRATRARNINSNKKELSPERRKELLSALKARFEKNMNRHKVMLPPSAPNRLMASCTVRIAPRTLML
jgi:hypothetical protein